MNKNHAEVMLEQILHEVKAVHELVGAQPTRTEFSELREDVTDIKRRIMTIERAVKDTNHDLATHKRQPRHGIPADYAPRPPRAL